MITTVVSGIKVTLELDLFDKEDIIKDLNVVNKTSQELSKTIDSFRETYEFGHKKEDFNIKKLILKDLQMLEPAYSYQNIVFIANLQEQEYYGYKDEFLLVFNKLLQNAKDALLRSETKEGLIFIDLVTHMNKITVSVRDNAGGVDEEISDKIFEPYFTTKHQSQGVGLSLYMSRNIISKYFQGDLLFKNVSYSYENKTYDGAEFKITFPFPL
jgi:signal transduction histidine kinase